MDRLEKLAFSDESYFLLARGDAIFGIAFLIFSFGVVLVTTDATLADLALPFTVLGAFWFVWVGFHGFAAWVHRTSDKRAINRMFDGEIWECWQFRALEWQVIVDNEYNIISPKEEGLKAYIGAIYSSIAGVVLAVILLAVGTFAIQDPLGNTIVRICAVAVFLLLLGVGLFQPVVARYNAQRYRHKALQVPEPRVWFASDGIYHETLGYTSLKDLEKVTDQTKSCKAIQFTLTVTSVFGGSDHSSTSTVSIPYPFPVPTGCEEQAAKLVHRYRQERLHQ
ncbi:hypothetical protein ACFLSV_06725 [Bacteroidota bacterium]